MILYSVILPWHKDDDLLRRARESVPQRADTELIAIEDKDRLGAGRARNEAIKKASGKWLIFLDSDDFFTPGAFSVLDRHAADEADVVYFNVSGRPAEKQRLLAAYASRPACLEFYCRYCYPEPWGKMVSREFVLREGIRFDSTLCANDYMFSVLCGLKAGRVAYDDAAIYEVTEREGSVSSKYFDSPLKLRDRLDVYWRVQQELDRAGVRLYPFAGIWMMCRKEGGEAYSIASEFRINQSISRVKIWADCCRRILRKRLRMGVPYNA